MRFDQELFLSELFAPEPSIRQAFAPLVKGGGAYVSWAPPKALSIARGPHYVANR